MIIGNEPAMPTISYRYEDGSIDYSGYGLTIHQLFAAVAMAALCGTGKYEFCAAESVKYADALIVELNKEK